MVKLKLSIFLLFIILATSFMPLYADNDIKAIITSNESTFSEDMSSFVPRKRPKSKKRGGKKGGRRGGGSDISFEKGKIEVDAGVGLSIFAVFPGMKMNVPPISLGGEYCFWSGEKSSWGVGLNGAFHSVTFTEPSIDMSSFSGFKIGESKPVVIDFTTFYAGAKISWHYNLSSNVEFFWSLGIGYFGMSLDGDDSDGDKMAFNYNGPLPTNMIGFKFFFTDNIGAFVDFGFDGAKVVGAGLALKF